MNTDILNEPMAGDRREQNLQPVGRICHAFSFWRRDPGQAFIGGPMKACLDSLFAHHPRFHRDKLFAMMLRARGEEKE